MAVLAQDLRDAVLQAAFQGKLTQQLDTDSSVDELLEKIKQEKEQMIKDKKIKKEKPLPSIEDSEKPFDIPDNWRWERVGNIADCGAGATPSRSRHEYYDNGTIPWLKTGELTNSYIIKTEECITEKALKECSLRMNKIGDILIAMYGATIGKLGIVTYPLTTNQACCGCTVFAGIYNLYLFYYFMETKRMLIDKAEGGAQPNISREKIRNSPIPLPPIEEQSRIVAKIEEIMAKIDEYEKLEKRLEEIKKQFPIDLKDALLQAAMRGKLTEQLPTDSSVDDLLEQIAAEKKKLEDEGKIKKSKKDKESQQNKHFVDLGKEEYPFEIPKSWKWENLSSLVSIYSGLSYKKGDLSQLNDSMVTVFRGGNIGDLKYQFKQDDVKIAKKFIKNEELYLKKNQLITPAVTSLEQLGKVARVDKNYADVVAGGFVLNLMPYLSNNDTLSKYLLYAFSSRYVKLLCHSIANKSGQAFYNLSREKLGEILVPIPPIEEQQRIVGVLDKLLLLCEGLI